MYKGKVGTNNAMALPGAGPSSCAGAPGMIYLCVCSHSPFCRYASCKSPMQSYNGVRSLNACLRLFIDVVMRLATGGTT